jgi:Stress responsive A/B Barrel Domain
MVVHVVLFKFSDASHASEARSRLLGMKGRIPGLLGVEAGEDFARSQRSFDLALITRHESREALGVYQTHPVHEEVAAFIRSKMTGAAAVDFDA